MLKTKRTIGLLLVFSLTVLSARADTVSRLLQKHKQTKATFAILAVDANSGSVLYQKNARQAMIPASNMKLVTASAALHYLGGDYSFQTRVGLLGKDLVVIGSGDPLLGEPKLDTEDRRSLERMLSEIVSQLKQAGVGSVQNVVMDVSFFDNNRVHPSWPPDQLNQWYACEVSGLNIYNNCVRIVATRKGGSAVLTMEPSNSYIQLVNQLKLKSSGSSAVGAYRSSIANKLLVKGKLNKQAGFDVAIENPQGLFASILRDRLKKNGIAVKGKIVQKYVKHDKAFRALCRFETPISDVLARCNKNSLGLAAECLVKTISAENTQGRINGEWAHGQALIRRYLKSLGVEPEQVVLDDGSGLSRNNRLSATVLVAVLKDMYEGADRAVFYDSLAVGGVDGTIYKYFRESPYKGAILGKTGYISGVRSFSGICKTPRGDVLVSILTERGNGYTRACINDITEAFFDGKF
ncbi:MAG: D-alanyl-D-alanine carboxypeptidase/D-alanyl-D-alanine endopeptidase [Planctomycetota bacterium]